jgi:hypothetical protein
VSRRLVLRLGECATTQEVPIGVLLCSGMRLLNLLSSPSSDLQQVELAVGGLFSLTSTAALANARVLFVECEHIKVFFLYYYNIVPSIYHFYCDIHDCLVLIRFYMRNFDRYNAQKYEKILRKSCDIDISR